MHSATIYNTVTKIGMTIQALAEVLNGYTSPQDLQDAIDVLHTMPPDVCPCLSDAIISTLNHALYIREHPDTVQEEKNTFFSKKEKP